MDHPGLRRSDGDQRRRGHRAVTVVTATVGVLAVATVGALAVGLAPESELRAGQTAGTGTGAAVPSPTAGVPLAAVPPAAVPPAETTQVEQAPQQLPAVQAPVRGTTRTPVATSGAS